MISGEQFPAYDSLDGKVWFITVKHAALNLSGCMFPPEGIVLPRPFIMARKQLNRKNPLSSSEELNGFLHGLHASCACHEWSVQPKEKHMGKGHMSYNQAPGTG
jgi:hypothetical protein